MTDKKPSAESAKDKKAINSPKQADEKAKNMEDEYGGSTGPEPTRYGDWENGGRCTDF